MRDISPETLEEIFAQYNPSPLLYLLRFKGVDNSGAAVERFYVQNWEAIESNGVLYQPAAFKIKLADDSSDGMPQVTLTADAGDESLVSDLREFKRKPNFYLSLIAADRPDVVEYPEVEFEVTNWSVRGSTIQITLSTEPVLNEPVPADIGGPSLFPLNFESVVIKND